MTRYLRLAAAAALAALAVAACSSDSGTTASPATTGPGSTGGATSAAPSGGGATSGGGGQTETATITIKDFKFGAPLTVQPGQTITVTNEDGAPHDVTADDGSSFKTPSLAKGESTTITAPTKAGTYKFSCSLHPKTMKSIGTLTVQG